jgi:hypothetical protein
MTTLQLTPAQRRFIDEFDIYTRRGTEPREYGSLRDSWRVQHRTMNACRREGLLIQKGICQKTGNPTFIINPEFRDSLGLRRQIFVAKIFRPRRRIKKTY